MVPNPTFASRVGPRPTNRGGFNSRHYIYSHVDTLLIFVFKGRDSSYLLATVSLLRSHCMPAWCPTFNTPGLLCCDPNNGPGPSACQVPYYPRHAWADTGIVVCLFVCDNLFYSPRCYSTAFTACIAFTQQDFGGRF